MPLARNYNTKFKEAIHIPDCTALIHPGDNFYKHVNAKWLEHTVIPPYQSSYSVNEEIEKVIEKDLFKILEESKESKESQELKPQTKSQNVYSQLNHLVGSLALSAKNQNSSSINTLKRGLQKIQFIRCIEDIGSILGYFTRLKIDTFIGTYLQLERIKENKNIYTLVISLGTLGLPDTTYYSGTKSGILFAYIKMCTHLGKLLDLDDLTDSITLEAFLSAHINNSTEDDSTLLSGIELSKIFKTFPYESFFKSYGILDWKKYTFRIQSKKYIHLLEKIFLTIPLHQWKKLFMLHLILNSLTLLPNPYNNIYFEFYGKMLHSQEEKITAKYLQLSVVKEYATKALSLLYVKKYLHDNLKKEGTQFIESIRSSALNRIKNNAWMYDDTKVIACKKLKHMKLCIGWPETYPPYILPNLSTHNLLENTLLLSEASTLEDIVQLNKESSVGKWWTEPAFNVNAFYYNEINEYIIPAASLFFPFYGRSIGWNYGGLGAVIGHEMVHAFDKNGKDYDEYGLEKNWWHLRDNRRFNKLSAKLIELFNKTKINGHSVDGEKTLSENLADLGGVSIALDALKLELTAKKYTACTKAKELKEFFISYAVSWRTKEKKKKLLEELFMDAHSPPELRVNNIVSQFDEWYEVFDIKETHKLYIPPENRINIY